MPKATCLLIELNMIHWLQRLLELVRTMIETELRFALFSSKESVIVGILALIGT